ncbi:MAG: 1-deoxy-D-xylulose-5-phosphate reductoisomerase [Panacagrimonas sp.]
MLRLLVLGATGSVGRSTLDVAARHPDRVSVVGLAANRDVDGMLALVQQFRPGTVAMADAGAAKALRDRLRQLDIMCEVGSGAGDVTALAGDASSAVVMSAIAGAAGLPSTLAAIRAGKRVLIANKEPLVMAGRLMIEEAAGSGATIIPIDSEHNAIFQCLPSNYRCGQAPAGVRRLILTSSGGPFRELPIEAFAHITPAQAVRHPNWTMGPKISVDSATLMNKGLELIEAAALYQLPPEQLEVVVHPESVIHSLVEYVDGSTLAQLGQPDMRVPIAHALAWPERWESGVGGLDFGALARLRFVPPDFGRFPCLGLARAALASGGIFPNVLNAANEVAVEAFLNGRLGFLGIPQMVERCCDAAVDSALPAPVDIDSVLVADRWARAFCQQRIADGTAHD